MRRLSSVDAQFLAIEDGRTHAHVCQLTILEGTAADGSKIDAARIRDLLTERIDLMPPLRWRVKEVPFGLDYPVFVEDDAFDLESHLWETALPEPGTDEQLGEAVGQIASRPLDRSRPLWELHLIHGLEGGRVAILTKLHHSAIDGVSGIEMLGALLDPTPSPTDADAQPVASDGTAGKDPGDVELLARAFLALPRQPVRMLRGCRRRCATSTSCRRCGTCPAPV